MKLRLLTGVSIFALGLGWSSAHAADAIVDTPRAEDLWYVTLFGGASFPNNVKTDFYGDQYSVDLKTGFVIGGAVGRRINDVFRVEGELSYARYKASEYNYGGPNNYPASGNLSATYLLANVWADVAHFGDAKLYVGGGLGAAYVTADTNFDGNDYGYGPGGWGFAGQVGAGITYAVTQNVDLDFGYRFKAVTSVDLDDNDGGGTYENAKLYSHNLQLGVTLKF
ncbi:porin family protein [Mesorhizobium sp. M7A.F.Ca.CA.001.09.2.1]|uniref:Acyloxyacyl hydrolase n=1 Tax=Mesorhizobium ciceri TaxID=39645 RepID=A0AB38T7L9_9HYPH|nr:MULTISPECIES: outer membrane beta-barrel protein [Mesorhizobium]RUY58091.1 porin family protein [Mesorhizobium sp. M7A.F.Ca.CA.001.13.2.1]RVA33716.1 porin family protein [Mesorhizobium sp. M7A.F.Ca.US.001.01.1.1]MDF3218573.1 acyloxyacyl hydrolase [Mesorhizobium ciceri]RUY65975.1 porin family protein [Mesorhizobium sp. M7A.F.Ca.CA.001.13.1.1]RUY68315.1 porin family protein [Mesorhizobium sp. M7A.F.Ca.CA.001.05.1.1]